MAVRIRGVYLFIVRQVSGMTERIREILKNMKHYNAGDLVRESFGLKPESHYDVLVVAPAWTPAKIMDPDRAEITTLRVHSYISGYEVNIGSNCIGWIQTSSGACNLIDGLLLCAQLHFDKLVFVGAVGGLKETHAVGDICTPSCSIEGTMASAYLSTDPRDFTPFETVYPNDPNFVARIVSQAAESGISVQYGRVFCTDSISCEYSHLPFINSFDADLIEMETSAFYRLAEMLEKPAVALLVVSDNSASGKPLLGKSEVQAAQYDLGRKTHIPRLIEEIANLRI